MAVEFHRHLEAVGSCFAQLAEEKSKLAAEVSRLKSNRPSNSTNTEPSVRVGALREAVSKKDWGRVALEVGQICEVEDDEKLRALLQAIAEAAGSSRVMQKAKLQRRKHLQQRVHSDLAAVQPELPLGNRKLDADSTIAVLASSSMQDLARIACTARGSRAVVYAPQVLDQRSIDLSRSNVKTCDNLLSILGCGGRWSRVSGLKLPCIQIRMDAWADIAAAVPSLAHLNLTELHGNLHKPETVGRLSKHFPSLRTLRLGYFYDGTDIAAMAEHLGRLVELEDLHMHVTVKEESGRLAFPRMLTSLRKLKTFFLKSVRPHNLYCEFIRLALQHKTLKHLVLRDTSGLQMEQQLIAQMRVTSVQKITVLDVGRDRPDEIWERIRTAVPNLIIETPLAHQPHFERGICPVP
eukprot:TRINITY_DN20932_c0_g3_i1.p1 TRINITY_DN20932_c0_g3~~TRINITY_DN20932_c0_g3_i1.p1  ORF type:complete len:408 (+),score=35.92 TRINITY_DN20932_c0_g3_i1:74-1297(+)